MKILHISTGIQRIPPDKAGNPEGHMFFLSRQLANMGQEVTIVDRKHSSSDPPLEQVDGVTSYGFQRNLSALVPWKVDSPSFTGYAVF